MFVICWIPLCPKSAHWYAPLAVDQWSSHDAAFGPLPILLKMKWLISTSGFSLNESQIWKLRRVRCTKFCRNASHQDELPVAQKGGGGVLTCCVFPIINMLAFFGRLSPLFYQFVFDCRDSHTSFLIGYDSIRKRLTFSLESIQGSPLTFRQWAWTSSSRHFVIYQVHYLLICWVLFYKFCRLF